MKFKKLPATLPAILLLLSCCLFSLVFLSKPLPQTTDDAFLAFTKKLFCSQISSDTLTLHYALADPAAFEITDAPVTLGLYSPENETRSLAALENTRAALKTFSRQELSPDNQLTYDILEYQLEQEQRLSSYDYYKEIFSPTLGIQAQLPILLAEYAFRSRQDIEDYLALLAEMDTYYTSLLEYQKQKATAGRFMSEETADAVIAGCKAFLSNPSKHFLLSTFEERIGQADFLTEEAKKNLSASNRAIVFGHVFPAYELLIEGLTKLKGTGQNAYGLGYYEQGRDYYEALVSCTVGTGRTMEEISSLIDTQIHTDLETMASIVARHPKLLKTVSRTIDAREPVYILELLEQKIQQDFPEVPGSDCEVKYVDSSLEDYLSPAFYLTPPMDQMSDHVIYINPAGNTDNLSLFTTLAHEGYPGHLYQTLYESSCNLNPVRSLFYFGGYVEGWATYAERYSYSYTGLEADAAALLSSNSFLSLGLHARADVGIHYEGWTPTETAAFFEDYGITDTAAVSAIYQAILQDPGNYLKYYLGALEIQELKKTAEAVLGDAFVLKSFHEFLLSIGPAPFPILASYMDSWLHRMGYINHK